MRQPAALFPILLALGAAMLVPGSGAQAAPTRIKACQTITQPGSYVLENDLIATGDCLVITASFVTIDLAGFSISTTNGAAISATSSTPALQGIAVRNGSITGGNGVILASRDLSDGPDASIVENLRVSVIDDGILAKGIVRGNTVTASFPLGAHIIASGIVADNYVFGGDRRNGMSATGVVRGNAVVNGGSGMGVGVGSTVIGNTVAGTFAGLIAQCPSNLTDNTAVNNTVQDLVLEGQGCHNEDNVAPKTQP
jgi:hypothetical protein